MRAQILSCSTPSGITLYFGWCYLHKHNKRSEHVILCALYLYFQNELFRALMSIMQDFHARRAMFSETLKIINKTNMYIDFKGISFKNRALRHLRQSSDYADQISTLKSLAKRRSVLFQELVQSNHDFHQARLRRSPENGSL